MPLRRRARIDGPLCSPLPPGSRRRSPPRVRAVPFLRVEQGSCPGQILEVKGERVVIGRHPGCEIVLDNAAVSRQHAQICESHGSYFLEDLRSRNRTYLNDRPVDGAAELRNGDSIRLCELEFKFFVDSPPVEEDRRTAM